MRRYRGYGNTPYIYFARDQKTGLVKIGKTTDPFRRMYQLCREHQCDIELITAVRCKTPPEYYERFIQLEAVAKHEKGEWFRLTPEEVNGLVPILQAHVASTKPPKARALWPVLPWRRKFTLHIPEEMKEQFA